MSERLNTLRLECKYNSHLFVSDGYTLCNRNYPDGYPSFDITFLFKNKPNKFIFKTDICVFVS